MPRYLNTTGDPALDRELDDLRALIQAARATASAPTATAVSSVQTVQQTFVVSTADGATVVQAGSLQVTTGTGLTLGQVGDAALLGLTLTAGTGIGIAGATISNSGVTSWNGNTGAVTYTAPVTSVNGLTGAVTIAAGGTWTVDNTYNNGSWSSIPLGNPISTPTAPTMFPCNMTAAALTLLLPSSSSYPIIVKKVDSGGNTLTLKGTGGALIDGAATQVISTQYARIGVVFDGTNWQIIC